MSCRWSVQGCQIWVQMGQIGPKWGTFDLKSPVCVPFQPNLTHFMPKSEIPVSVLALSPTLQILTEFVSCLYLKNPMTIFQSKDYKVDVLL